MLSGDELRTIVQNLPNRPLNGILYRAGLLNAFRTPPQPSALLSEQRFLHGYGSSKHGARYTPINGPRAVCFGEDRDGALAESILTGNLNDPMQFPPHIIFSVKVSLASLLDLGDLTIQQQLETSEPELVEPWRLKQARGELVPTQILGKIVCESGRYQAIRYPSAQLRGHYCVVVFNEHVVAPSFVEIIDPDGNLRERIP